MMKKTYLSNVCAITCAVVLGISPITVCASSKMPTDPSVKTEDVHGMKEISDEQESGVPGSLTPDGNLNLVDDYGDHQRSGKQFITVETKSGKYFYIIIDRDDNGTETVHFLNKVDEDDLLALMEEEAVQEYLAEKEEVEPDKPSEGTVEETEEEPGEEDAKEEPVVAGLQPVTGLFLIVGIMGFGVVGGYFYLKKNKKPQPKESAAEEELSIDLNEMDLDDEDLDMEEEE